MSEVTVTNIKMPFGSMIVFMVKWAVASIPAILILVVMWSFGDRRSNHHRKCRALAKADLMGSIDLFVQLSRFSSNKT